MNKTVFKIVTWLLFTTQIYAANVAMWHRKEAAWFWRQAHKVVRKFPLPTLSLHEESTVLPTFDMLFEATGCCHNEVLAAMKDRECKQRQNEVSNKIKELTLHCVALLQRCDKLDELIVREKDWFQYQTLFGDPFMQHVLGMKIHEPVANLYWPSIWINKDKK